MRVRTNKIRAQKGGDYCRQKRWHLADLMKKPGVLRCVALRCILDCGCVTRRAKASDAGRFNAPLT